MAAVYSAEQDSLLQTNAESPSSENPGDDEGSGGHDEASCLDMAASEPGLGPGGPAPEAWEPGEETGNAAFPHIKIKEEQIEESEYITVRVNVSGEESEEQTGGSAGLSSREESADGECWLS